MRGVVSVNELNVRVVTQAYVTALIDIYVLDTTDCLVSCCKTIINSPFSANSIASSTPSSRVCWYNS